MSVMKNSEHKFDKSLVSEIDGKYFKKYGGFSREVVKNKCLACSREYYTLKSSNNCSDKCRAVTNSKENEDKITNAHFKMGESKSSVELFTPSGFRFIVDNDDLHSILRYRWTNDKDGYITTRFRVGEKWYNMKLHRIIMSAKQGEIIDHINGIPWDNRSENLRISNKSLNGYNRHKTSGKSGIPGVVINNNGTYTAKIKLPGSIRRHTQRTFETEQAARDYRKSFVESLASYNHPEANNN